MTIVSASQGHQQGSRKVCPNDIAYHIFLPSVVFLIMT
jgi:hypothetical protein